MASVRQLVLDVHSALSFKRGIAPLESTSYGRGWEAPTWVGAQHERRLAAYKVLYATFRNCGREFLGTDDEEAKAQHREYGDANLLVKVVLAAVLGDDISLVVADSDDKENQAAVARQAWLEDWAETERLRAKIMETERDAQIYGDGVYVLTNNLAKRRTRVRLFDPGFYFPELDPNAAEDEFPTRVHIAWEYEARTGPRQSKSYIRRMTWELAPLPDGQTRRYAWNGEASSLTCYMTDATWAVGDTEGYDVENFPMSRATFALQDSPAGPVAVERLDLGIDFLPVVHMPNTVEIKAHFGEALISAVAQILDDLARADTDSVSAAELAGRPMVAATDMAGQDFKVRAGTVLPLGPQGTIIPLDLSAGLKACMEFVTSLRDRLNENSRVPAEVVGRMKANQDRSGIELALSWGPMRSLVEEMRLVRNEKYPVLLRFVQRMSMAAGWLEGDVLPAEVRFGSFLPTDKTAIVDLVIKLWDKKVISRQTGLQLLVDEGVLNVDVAAELARAEADDVEMAAALRDATEGDFDAVYELLHRERPEESEPEPAIDPTIPLPPAPERQ